VREVGRAKADADRRPRAATASALPWSETCFQGGAASSGRGHATLGTDDLPVAHELRRAGAEPNALADLGDIDVALDSTGKTAVRQSIIGLLGKRGVLACVGHGERLSLTVSSDLIATERTA
jgi:hypothetical protein